MRFILVTMLLILLNSSSTVSSDPLLQLVEIEGTVLKVTMNDGRVLHSPDLIGANIVFKQPDRLLHLRIDGIERDPDDERANVAAADVIWLHNISIERPDGSHTPLCDPGPDGRREAIPVAGYLQSSNARFVRGHLWQFELACTSGAMGKCIRFGYHPWQTHTLPPSISMLSVYNACLRMVRADYGGGGEGTTRNGMRILLYDYLGFHPLDRSESATDPPFEAGWTQDGAVCVNHPRVSTNVTLKKIEVRWPQLVGKTGAICTEAFARSHGAVLYNRSERQ